MNILKWSKYKNKIYLLIVFLFLNFSCTVSEGGEKSQYYKKPEQKDDGWSVSTLKEAGMNRYLIENMIKKILIGDFDIIHALLIVKNGKLVLDDFYKKRLTVVDSYVNNTDIELHAMMSVTKSIISLMMGIAIEKDIVGSIDDRVYPYFPEYKSYKNWSKQKSGITIKDFLMMAHGLSWEETSYKYSDPRNTYYQMEQEDDWVKFTLDRKLVNTQGEKFVYSSGVSHTTEALISNASGMIFSEFTDKYFFIPLGIKKKNGIKPRTEERMMSI